MLCNRNYNYDGNYYRTKVQSTSCATACQKGCQDTIKGRSKSGYHRPERGQRFLGL